MTLLTTIIYDTVTNHVYEDVYDGSTYPSINTFTPVLVTAFTIKLLTSLLTILFNMYVYVYTYTYIHIVYIYIYIYIYIYYTYMSVLIHLHLNNLSHT